MDSAIDTRDEPAPSAYNALDSSKHEIRVLDVSASRLEGEPLACTIRHVSLKSDTRPRYETISYYWGPPGKESTILLNGEHTKVPTKSEAALRCLVTGSVCRTLWIDAICINQNDIREREQQVAMMGSIYALCTRTLVYLGTGGGLIDRAQRNILAIHDEVRKDMAGSETFAEFMQSSSRSAAASTSIETPLDEKALRGLYSRHWFQRVWVVQEVILSPQAICYCGHATIDLRTVLEVAVWVAVYHRPHISMYLVNSGMRNASRIWYIGKHYANGSTAIGNLMVQSQGCHATDPRDKVFALLGLHEQKSSEEHVLALVAPNYRKTTAEVLRDAVRYSIATTTVDKLLLLNRVSHRDEEELEDDALSSWVHRMDRLWRTDADPDVLFKHASLPNTDLDLPVPSVLGDPRELLLHGHKLDRISSTSAILKTLKKISNAAEWLNEVQNMVPDCPQSLESLARTIIGDSNGLRKPASKDDFEAFRHVLHRVLSHTFINSTWKLEEDGDATIRATSYYLRDFLIAAKNRRFSMTRNHYMGLVPQLAQEGDLIVLLGHGCFPSVLRRKEDHFIFIGQCYIDGAMSWQEKCLSLVEQVKHITPQEFRLH